MTLLHGIASREDLPLPFEFVVSGAALTLILTFAILFFAWREPRYDRKKGRELPRLTALVDSPWFTWGFRILVWIPWALATLALVAGVDRIDNPIFGWVLVVVWVGLVPAALLCGRVHRFINPVRLFTGGFTQPESRDSVLPAAAAITAFLYLELIEPKTLVLATLQIVTLVWLAWVIAGAWLRGKSWVERAEPFEAFANTVSHLSPWARSERGMVMFMNPLRHLGSWRPPKFLAVLTTVLLGGTLYDAISASTWWVRLTQELPLPHRVVGALGLLLTLSVVTGLFYLCALPLRYGKSLRETADDLAPSLVPLVVGYSISHYFTYLYLEGQRAIIRLNDPMGRNQNLFGFIEAAPDTTLFMFPTVIAVGQVVLIVGGHVIGALLAHDISLRVSKKPKDQLPLLLAMVVLTVGGMTAMFG